MLWLDTKASLILGGTLDPFEPNLYCQNDKCSECDWVGVKSIVIIVW